MPTHVKQGGAWLPIKDLFVKQAGVWTPVQRALVKNAGTWSSIYEAMVTVTLSSGATNVDVKTLFSTDDWSNPYKKKKLVIAPGVIIGATSTATAALRTGSDRQGLLEVVVNGEVQGAGGATTSAAGGAAINVQQPGVTIFVNGAVRGGGGAGGVGGTGGGGYYGYTVSEGPLYQANVYSFTDDKEPGSPGFTSVYWGGFLNSVSYGATSYVHGGVTYYKGALAGGGGAYKYYSISRSYPATAYTSGGVGGAGARGQGYGFAAGTGANGVGGGTNAGTGGRGGNGGTWGAAGATGATGASGNYSGGAAGAAGGAAGAAITGVARTVVNAGTINGDY